MLDFNPERIPWIEDRIKRRTGETEGRDWRVITSPTTILAGEVFKYDIESKLPYYEVRKTGLRVEADYTFYIDDNWVVLIRVCSHHHNVANIRLILTFSSRDVDRISLMGILSTVHSVLGSST